MHKPFIRVLAVDDHECWRRLTSATLENGLPESTVVGEACDGWQAIQLVRQLQPDLVVLDIGLPQLNGIEVARTIRHQSPDSRIIFMTENRSADIADAALSTGALGYVVKSDAGRALLPAINAVLEGRRFISSGVAGHVNQDKVAAIPHRHDAAFYPDDASLVDGYASFIKSALNAGDAVIVLVTNSHRSNLIQRLEADGIDTTASIQEGSYVEMDVSEAMTTMLVNGLPDPTLCAKAVRDVAIRASKGIRGKHNRVMPCGEVAPTMLLNGYAEGAIQLEHLWDEITRDYAIHTLCGYLSSAVPQNDSAFQRICAEHSAIHGREPIS